MTGTLNACKLGRIFSSAMLLKLYSLYRSFLWWTGHLGNCKRIAFPLENFWHLVFCQHYFWYIGQCNISSKQTWYTIHLKILKKSRKFSMTPSVCLNQKKRNEGQFTGKACWLAEDSLAALVLFKPLCLLTDPGPSCHNKTLPQFRHGHLWVDVPPNACYHFANQPDGSQFCLEAVEPIGPNDDYFNVLKWAQVAILGFLPTIICILVVFAIVSQGIRLVIVLAGKLRSCHVDVVRKEKKLILKLLSLMIATSSRMAILTTPMTCLLRFLGRELS